MARNHKVRGREWEYLEALPHRQNQTKFVNSEFDQLDKSKLREVMHGEQASLCVYCERRLSESCGNAHIEHWRPPEQGTSIRAPLGEPVSLLRDSKYLR